MRHTIGARFAQPPRRTTASGFLSERALRRLGRPGVPLIVRDRAGRVEQIGLGEPVVEVEIRSDRGREAVNSLSELHVVDAYLDGDIDLHGDLISAMHLRTAMTDVQLLIRAGTMLGPLLLGRKRMNPQWIAQHYDSENMQLYALDEDYQIYTPGLYEGEDDTLEEGAERKLEYAFDALQLGPGDSLLDVGCGWGGFLRYCAARGVRATGISLSRHQLAYAERRLAADGLEATTQYEDFFTYRPSQRFNAISLMGSIEDLSDYGAVMRRLQAWLGPGGRIYMDFAARDWPWGVASFVTKYVWPGAFRMVYLPSFTRALARTHFDLVEIQNDRRNYYLWPKKGLERWTERRDEVVTATDERTWRMMQILMAGTAYVMGARSIWATAYRVVLEARAAPAHSIQGFRARDGAIAD
jgi:cyclopropane-fatty-acyl-phospholipid synthase